MIYICLILNIVHPILGTEVSNNTEGTHLIANRQEMKMTKWEYKIVDHSNSTAMGYSNEETEAFKIEHEDTVHWKYEMSRIELNKLGQESWKLVTQDGASQIYLRRPL